MKTIMNRLEFHGYISLIFHRKYILMTVRNNRSFLKEPFVKFAQRTILTLSYFNSQLNSNNDIIMITIRIFKGRNISSRTEK